MSHAALPSPVLVLGATSLVGRFLLPRLAQEGVRAIGISRVTHLPLPERDWMVADLTNPDLRLDVVAQGAFSLGPLWLLPPALPALRDAGVRRLVAFSSTSRFTKERSPVAAERAVARRLLVGEEKIRSFCEQEGISWTLLRPTLIYAEGFDRNVTRIANLIQRTHVFPLSGDGAGKRQPVHAQDLAAGALNAAVSLAASNRAYDVPGGETLSYRTMVERIFHALRLRPRIIAVHPAAWHFGLRLASPLLPGVTTAMGSRMAEDLTFDSRAAEQDFLWQPRGFWPQFRDSRTAHD